MIRYDAITPGLEELRFLESFLGFKARILDTKLRPRNSRRKSHTWYT